MLKGSHLTPNQQSQTPIFGLGLLHFSKSVHGTPVLKILELCMLTGFAAMTTTDSAMLQELHSKQDQNKATLMYFIVNNLIKIPAGQRLIATGIAKRGHHQRVNTLLHQCVQWILLSINSPPLEWSPYHCHTESDVILSQPIATSVGGENNWPCNRCLGLVFQYFSA